MGNLPIYGEFTYGILWKELRRLEACSFLRKGRPLELSCGVYFGYDTVAIEFGLLALSEGVEVGE